MAISFKASNEAFAEKLSKDTLDYSWKMMWAFSVDDDANAPGEWVHAGFDEVGILDGDTVEKAMIEEWYYGSRQPSSAFNPTPSV